MIFGPLALSPGPANILFAASGQAFGIRGSLPFWLGTNITCVFQTLAIGFGLGILVSEFPSVIFSLKAIGIVILLVLAYRFYKLSVSDAEVIKPLSFRQGVVVELFNMKFLLIPMIMFSQFNAPANDGMPQVLVLTSMLAILTMGSNMVWIIGGKTLTLIATGRTAVKTQGWIFASMLCVTALWLALG